MENAVFRLATPRRGATYQYRHTLDALVDAQRTPLAQQQHVIHRHATPTNRRDSFGQQRTPRHRASFNRSSPLRVAVHDITAILSVSIQVDDFQFDSSMMEHPEFLISTHVVFQCQQLGTRQLETSWRLYRTFAEFQGLDLQLRRKFPFDMCDIAPPRKHRRRTFFRLHRSPSFLAKRCTELSAYLAQVLDAPTMRLTRFADPRAPLILRCFCNFDVGFGKKLRIRPEQPDACVLCLNHIGLNSAGVIETNAPPPMPSPPPKTPVNHQSNQLTHDLRDGHELLQRNELEMLLRLRQRSQSLTRSDVASKADSKMDELEANLLDDRARHMSLCLRYECSCQNMSFQLTEGKMARILRLRGYRQIYRPIDVDGPTALYCVLYRLQQHNDLDCKLHAILHESTTESPPNNDERGDDVQLAAGVELLRDALANYALLHVHIVAPHFRMDLVDLTKKIHEFKSRQQQRIGALELVLLCSMLDLSIMLITNDHEGTVQEIFPLPGLDSLRRGGRMLITLGYILPTMMCVNGLYTLADHLRPDPSTALLTPAMWQGLDEMDRCLVAFVDVLVMQSELRRFEQYDESRAETLNRAILDAVWNDCQHNPNLFNLFQRQARQFGKSRTTAYQFFQYLEIAFGVEGAAYLVDFLLYVLPEATLRKQLLRARWRRVQRLLTKRVAAVTS